MGKICYINGQPYSVGLPTGGENEEDHDNQWGEMIDFLGEDSNDVFHWSAAFSWCQNKPVRNMSYRAYRGCYSARYWGWSSAPCRSPSLGFRPVLTPLSADTLEPDPSLLKDIPDGQRIALASLYLDGKPVNLSKEKGLSYYRCKGWKITLRDRDKNKNNWLYVIKYKDLLWADRNVLVGISWDDLQKQGYTD